MKPHPEPLRRPGQAGTSLVEVMIAMAILAFVLLAFLSVMTSANKMSAVAKESAIATYILQSTLEDTIAATNNTTVPSYPNFWGQYWVWPTLTPQPPGTLPGADNSKIFQNITADAAIMAQIPTIQTLLPFVQANPPSLTPAQNATWQSIVTLFKNYPFKVAPTGRLQGEAINIYMMPTSDIYSGNGFNASTQANTHAYIEYMVEVTWTDASGKPRHESITTRRSQ